MLVLLVPRGGGFGASLFISRIWVGGGGLLFFVDGD